MAAPKSKFLKVVISLSLAAMVLGGCSDEAEPPVQDRLGLVLAEDLNSDPFVVEIELVAAEAELPLREGSPTQGYAFNGVSPGPLIEANVGDTLIVHFRNELPEPSTIHWHGVAVPANMDGSNISQGEVPAGGSFRYEFKLLRAGTFWYHPHFKTAEQVEKGLYAPLVVRDPGEESLGFPSRDLTMLIDDVSLDDENQLTDFVIEEPLERAETTLNGREGNVFLVNGREGRTHFVRRGVPERWRIINPANSRFMRLSIAGHRLVRIGGDQGLISRPEWIDPVGLVPNPVRPSQLISDPDPSLGLLLMPGERAEVIFTPLAEVGSELVLEWHDLKRGRHSAGFNDQGEIMLGHALPDGTLPPQPVLRIVVEEGVEDASEYEPPATLRPTAPIDASDADTIVATFGHSMPTPEGDITFFTYMVDGTPRPFPMLSAEEAPTVFVGETRIWEVVNLTEGVHPFHQHGFSFQPIEIEYIDMDNPANNRIVPFEHVEDKDTVLVPPRPGSVRMRSRTILRAAVHFDDTGREGEVAASGKEPGEDTSGGWLFHCHVLEHSASGMMGFFNLIYR